MCLLLETIKVFDGQLQNLEYHNRRFNFSRKEQFGLDADRDLGQLIRVPEALGPGVFRCRVLYQEEIEEIQFVEHSEIRVESLKLVPFDDIEYSLKYADRELLMELYSRRGDCDEILIVKQDFITDTSISNIVFRKEDGSWITPDTYLLKGTMRTFLIESGRISEECVRLSDLRRYNAARMINCMMDLDTSPLIRMDRIIS